MTANQQTVQKYMEAYSRSDHAEVLACLTDDVEWLIPGAFHVAGKEAFDAEIENPAFASKPAITVTRMIEDGEVVVAEGKVRTAMKDGTAVDIVFCDVFLMRDGKIRQLTSYVMRVND